MEDYRDSSVGIATRYELDGSEIESRWGGVDFPNRFSGLPSHLYNGYPVIPGSKVTGVNHPLPSTVEVIERVELYIFLLCPHGRL
jgi:hypothetical protein